MASDSELPTILPHTGAASMTRPARATKQAYTPRQATSHTCSSMARNLGCTFMVGVLLGVLTWAVGNLFGVWTQMAR